ncbi:hypothetical protein ZIOFF_039635 [Zingiber officinale]|uniref:Integrase catalytic domain-containing protein n=1 Tax=Zingiber officinale TaxID=94328 RepID=A0A8J5L3Z7_ZINOF|nr:hypothetical protein ZIOFF_039635 [Zingiber officinale]
MPVGFPILQQKDTSDCRTCVLGKHMRLPFESSSWRASEKLQLIHTDVCGPMSEAKSEVAETFEKFKKQVENECGRSIQIVRSDNGTEYTSASFRSICEESRVQHQFTVPYSPQQNGASERKNRNIMEMARCMMQEKDMPTKFWAKADNTAVFLQNRLPTKSVSMKTPHEAWYGVKPIMKNLKNGKVIMSRDVKFFEEEKWIWSGRESVSEHTSEMLVLVERNPEEQNAARPKMPVLVERNSEEQNAEGQNIEQQLSSEQIVDDTPIRGTRSLTDVYERCNVAVMGPASFEDAKKDRRYRRSNKFELYGFSYSDWAGSVDDIKSTSGYCFSLGSACFSWCSKKQEIVAQSTTEAEFVAVTSVVNQSIWLRKLLNDMSYIMEKETKVSVDNQAALAISKNPVFHGKTKHFNVKYYYLREVQQMGEVELFYCATEDQLADIFTKSFHQSRFVWLREKIGVSISA